jgi:hypothetical protein
VSGPLQVCRAPGTAGGWDSAWSPALVASVAAPALVLRPGDARAADRCGFLVDATVFGHAVTTEGADLERPGALSIAPAGGGPCATSPSMFFVTELQNRGEAA